MLTHNVFADPLKTGSQRDSSYKITFPISSFKCICHPYSCWPPQNTVTASHQFAGSSLVRPSYYRPRDGNL